MLIVLPPSETKAHGGTGPALDLTSLSFPELNQTRREIGDELAALPVPEALAVLGISEKLRGEAESNQHLWSSPTMPAIQRYTGVLFDALRAPTIPWENLAVGSALFGVVRAGDMIPHYRLSAQSKLGGRTLKSRWGAQITQVLDEEEGLVLDLRSGAYQQLGRLKRAITVRVETPDGKVVSHFNKHYKGVLANVLAQHNLESADEVVDVARSHGLDLSVTEPTLLTMVVTD